MALPRWIKLSFKKVEFNRNKLNENVNKLFYMTWNSYTNQLLFTSLATNSFV